MASGLLTADTYQHILEHMQQETSASVGQLLQGEVD
jgi:hypothetical protein